MVLETNDDYIIDEIDKQKRKLREISCSLEQQNQLLRLIVQVSVTKVIFSEWKK